MNQSSVVITGMGLVTPLGDSLPALMEALQRGEAALGKAPEQTPWARACVPDFDPARYANPRGMRVYNRATQLAIAATAMAMREADLSVDTMAPERIGLVMGSTFGHLDTLCEYDFGLVSRGMERTNPAWMPLAISSAPGSATALAFQIRGCSATLASGATSSLEALALGARMVATGRVSACIVTSAFSPAEELAKSAFEMGWLCGPGETRVFDEQSRGTGFGEAGLAFVLEQASSAQTRSRAVRGILRAQASAFAPDPSGRGRALTRAIDQALSRAACRPEDLALVASGANGVPGEDLLHAEALFPTIVEGRRPPAVFSGCGQLGDCVDASGLLQLAIGLGALELGVVPPIVGLGKPARPGLRYATQATAIDRGALLVTSATHTGSAAALVAELA
jgi:3-oxoacyl-[acyl-carrier-protein] synthase II